MQCADSRGAHRRHRPLLPRLGRGLGARVAGAAVVAMAGAGTSCGAGAGAGSPGASSVVITDSIDCPLPATPAVTIPAGNGGGGGPVGTVTATLGGGYGHPGGALSSSSSSTRAGSSSNVTATVPDLPGVPLPTPAASTSPGDVRIDSGTDTTAVAVHLGARVSLYYAAEAAVMPISDSSPGVLRDDGRSCNPDGSALQTFTAISAGTAILELTSGPRCLNAHPACLPGVRGTAVRVDVVA